MRKRMKEQRDYEERLNQHVFDNVGLPPMGEETRAKIDELLLKEIIGTDMEQFNLDNQFKLYLERVGLAHIPSNGPQYIELKRAFMGACGQLLVLFRDEMSALPEHKGVLVLQEMFNQTEKFWKKEAGM